MADPDITPRNTRVSAFFHGLSKVFTEDTQRVWSSLYKSSHSVKGNEVWADTVNYAVNAAAADAEAGANPAVTKYTVQTLTEIPGSNQQAYYLDVAGTWIRPWIAPTDIPDTVSNAPSYGYQAQLFRGDGVTPITPTEGTWEIDYYAGIIRFFPGSTPVDQGWGAVKVTLYQYTGAYGGIPSTTPGTFTVNQPGHGFSALDVIYWDGALWQLAQADDVATLGTHMVLQVVDVDNFIAGQVGRFTVAAHGLTPGAVYYLDDAVAGGLTTVEPTASGSFSQPFLVGGDVDVLYLLDWRAVPADLSAYPYGATGEPTGFPVLAATGEVDRVSSTILFNDILGFRIIPTGVDYTIYQDGVPYVINTALTINIPPVEGFHFFYFDLGVLTTTQVFDLSLLYSKVYVGVVYWDAVNAKSIYFGDERHGCTMDSHTHLRLHQRDGTSFVNGCAINGILTDQTGNLDVDAQFGLDAGKIRDEDILLDQSAIASNVGLEVFYKEGATGLWRSQVNAGFSVLTAGSGRLAWNEWTGVTWQNSEVPDTEFVMCHVFEINDPGRFAIAVMGRETFTTLALAEAAAEDELVTIVLQGMPFQEFLPIATIFFESDSGYLNAVQARTRQNSLGDDWIDWRFSDVNFTRVNVADHANLSNLTFALANHTGFQKETYIDPAADPTVNNDSVDTAGIGWEFREGDFWQNSTTKTLFKCNDATPGAAVWVPMGGGSVTIQDEGVDVLVGTTIVNFIGADVLALDDSGTVPGRVNVYIPAITFVSDFNTANGNNNCVVASAGTTSRAVANPGTFGIGGWAPGTFQNSVNATSWSFDTVNNCSFEDETTTIDVLVAGPTDNFGAPIAAHSTVALTTLNTPFDATVNNIRIRVDDTGGAMTGDYGKFKARIRVDIDFDAIIGDSGRFSVRIVHNNPGAVTFQQGPVFYDAQQTRDPLQDPFIGDSVTIAETGGGVVTRFLSGVEYYDLGSQFTIDIGDIDWLNSDSWPANVIQCVAPAYGLPTLTIPQADPRLVAGGWTTNWNTQNNSFQETAWAITALNYYYLGTTAAATATTLDTWRAGAAGSDSSPNDSIAVETHITGDTRLFEDFYDESWRCDLAGNFDLPAQRGWTSNVDLGAADACYWNGRAGRRAFDYTPYDPNAAGQPNYSASQNPTVYLVREFQHNGTASSNGRLNISGTYTSLELKLAKAWDGTATGGCVWVDMLSAYNFAQWNSGNPLGGTGCQTGSGAGYIDWTVGNLNVLNTNDTVYIRVGFTGAQEITTFNMVFS
jgi:hypothetical protein